MKKSPDKKSKIIRTEGNLIYVNFTQRTADFIRVALDDEGLKQFLGPQESGVEKTPNAENPDLKFRDWLRLLTSKNNLKNNKRNRAIFKKMWKTAQTLEDNIFLYKFLFEGTGYIDVFEEYIEQQFGIPQDEIKNHLENVIRQKNDKTADFWRNQYMLCRQKIPTEYSSFAYIMMIEMLALKDRDYLISDEG